MNAPTRMVPLHRLAHGRAGDKGNRLNVNIIAYSDAAWPILLSDVTEGRVRDIFHFRGATGVRRYELPLLRALNFVIDDALEGGVNSSLGLDTHGKTLSYLVLGLSVRIPPNFPLQEPDPRFDQPAVHLHQGG